MVIQALLNLLLLLVGTAAGVVWIKSLIEWDGKVHCDKDKCDRCPYSGGCEYENKTEDKEQ